VWVKTRHAQSRVSRILKQSRECQHPLSRECQPCGEGVGIDLILPGAKRRKSPPVRRMFCDYEQRGEVSTRLCRYRHKV
jgi:hypothetical protein